MAKNAGDVLDAFADRLKTQNVPNAAARPARYAMAVLTDNAVRALPWIRANAWDASAHDHLFERRTITVDDLGQFAETARREGGDFTALASFLTSTIEDIETERQSRASLTRGPAVLFSVGILAFLITLAGYAAFLDYRYHSDLLKAFETRSETLSNDTSPERLAGVAQLHGEVARASAAAPLSRLVTIPYWASGPKVEAMYRAEVTATLPDALREAIGEAIATEGDNIALYESLRAWAILTGRTDWAPAFLAGWIEARDAQFGIGHLAEHVFYLNGPEPRLAVPDDELMDQARQFAREADETDRAFLELLRDPDMRALGHWLPVTLIPEIEDIFVLRTGKPLADGVPRAFASGGWDLASSGKVDAAIRTARIEATKLFPTPAATSLDSRKGVLDKLQGRSIEVWKEWLEDLRIRPFADGDSARFVSGALSRRNSSFEKVLQEVWHQVGGDDPTRPVANRSQIEATFGPAIDYLRSGKISELNGLFASLSVALSTLDLDEKRGIDTLMNLQERARSIVALREAPPLVAQIAEDVLAQTSAVHAQVLTNPLTREWQARVYP
ncbi:hypothetical protein N9L47_13985, partial [Rhodobacteraceae bacterium]|nr:hypothetical protein [Paracoccaceae bacterium]